MRELNPDFALQSRLSFGRGARYGWLITAAALFVAFGGHSFETPTDVALMRAGVFLLLASLPYGAIQVRALERHGHLDARRLTGGSPVGLALALVGGSAWVLLLCGTVVLLAAAAAGYGIPALTLSAVVMLAIAIALLLLMMPTSTHVDSWMLLVLLAVAVFATVESMRADRGVVVGLLVVSAAILPWALPLALRRLRGAVPRADGPPVSPMRFFIRLRRTTYPEFAKALLLAGQSVSVVPLTAVAGTLSIWWLTTRWDATKRDIVVALAIYSPLILGGYETSARVHHEHATGGLDRLRLSGQASWKVVLELGTAYSLPFVVVSVVCGFALAVLDRENAGGLLAPWPLAAAILIFGPLLGGIRGRRPSLYVAGAIVLALIFARHPSSWIPGALAAATCIALAAASLERAERATFAPWIQIAGAASIAAIVASLINPTVPALHVAGVLSLSAGLLVADRVRVSAWAIVACAAATAAAAGIAEYVSVAGGFALDVRILQTPTGPLVRPAPGGRGVYAVVIGLYAAAGLGFGCWALNRFRDRNFASFAVRGIPLIVAVVLEASPSPWRSLTLRYGYNSEAVFELLLLAVLGAVASALVWRDAIRATPPPS